MLWSWFHQIRVSHMWSILTSGYCLQVEIASTTWENLSDARSRVGSCDIHNEARRHYFLGCKFQIFTDYKSLKYLFIQKDLNMKQRRWLKYMKDCDCIIEYTRGKANIVANVLGKQYTGMVKGGDPENRAEDLDLVSLWHRWHHWESTQIFSLTI